MIKIKKESSRKDKFYSFIPSMILLFFHINQIHSCRKVDHETKYSIKLILLGE